MRLTVETNSQKVVSNTIAKLFHINLSINNSFPNLSLQAFSRPKFNYGGYLTFASAFKSLKPEDLAFHLMQVLTGELLRSAFFFACVLFLNVKILGHCI